MLAQEGLPGLEEAGKLPSHLVKGEGKECMGLELFGILDFLVHCFVS